MEFGDSAGDSDFENQLLDHVVKSEKLLECLENKKLLEALGPLNENWFEELNEQFNEQMFHDAFNEKELSNGSPRLTNKDDEKKGSCFSMAAQETKTSSDLESLTQVLKQQLNDGNKFVYPSDATNVATTSDEDFIFFPGGKFDANFSSETAQQRKNITEKEKLPLNIQNKVEVEMSLGPEVSSFCLNSTTPKVTRHLGPVGNHTNCLLSDEKNSVVYESVISNEKVTVNPNQLTVEHMGGGRRSCDEQQNEFVNPTNSEMAFHKMSTKNSDCSTNSTLSSTTSLIKSALESSIGFTTASSKPITCSAQSLSKAKKLLEELDTSCSDAMKNNDLCERPAVTSTVGFQTASKKTLSISDTAWKNAQAFLATIESEDSPNVHEFVPAIPSTCLTNDKLRTDVCTLDSKSISSPCGLEKVTCVGFKTASNKSMSVTAASWDKGQSFMNNEDDAKDADSSSTINLTNAIKNYEVALNTPQRENQQRQADAKVESLSMHSPGFKAKRRNSLYKPPRKRPPLSDLPTNAPPMKRHSGDLNLEKSQRFEHQQSEVDMWQPNKRQLGIRQDPESQILVSDESLLKAVAFFEKV